MTPRILSIALGLTLLLGGCNRNDNPSTALPPPATLTSDAIGIICGMNLLEHPGPKGQIITASRAVPFWFTSARDALAFTLMPDQPNDIRAIYVSDMAQAPNWDEPGATNWIDARKAYFVIESRRQGGMGDAETIPFGTRTAAEAFASSNGGKVVMLSGISQSYVLGNGSTTDPSTSDQPRPQFN